MWRFYILMICFSFVLAGKKYKVTLLSAEKCPKPKGVIDRSESVKYDINVKMLYEQTPVIKANYYIMRPIGPVMMNFRLYQMKNNQLMFKFEKVNCRSPFTFQLMRVLSLDIDAKCMALPGNYTTKNIHLQDFSWIIGRSTITPGKYMYELEFYTAKGGIAVCIHIVCDIQI